ncbi:MAG: hypothetical protein QCI38_05010 [Candidatus Thermoplasmatota archaeon]|nr:hypothetical protein [Candidatus Thermoplasmatota archaeon]
MQGPHQDAQQSTTTKEFFFNVSSKFTSVTCIALPIHLSPAVP